MLYKRNHLLIGLAIKLSSSLTLRREEPAADLESSEYLETKEPQKKSTAMSSETLLTSTISTDWAPTETHCKHN
jgi:hypothetical protein